MLILFETMHGELTFPYEAAARCANCGAPKGDVWILLDIEKSGERRCRSRVAIFVLMLLAAITTLTEERSSLLGMSITVSSYSENAQRKVETP